MSVNHPHLQPRGWSVKDAAPQDWPNACERHFSGCCLMAMYDPGESQMFFDLESILERGENQSNRRKILKSGWDWLKLSPHTFPEVGGTNVEHNLNLTSPWRHIAQGHQDVSHLDINPAQQDLTSGIKWELVGKPYKATHRKVLRQFIVETKINWLVPRRKQYYYCLHGRSNSFTAKTHFPTIHRHWSKEKE